MYIFVFVYVMTTMAGCGIFKRTCNFSLKTYQIYFLLDYRTVAIMHYVSFIIKTIIKRWGHDLRSNLYSLRMEHDHIYP